MKLKLVARKAVGKMLQQIGIPKRHLKQDWFPGCPAE
jgi:hypothetical protein